MLHSLDIFDPAKSHNVAFTLSSNHGLTGWNYIHWIESGEEGLLTLGPSQRDGLSFLMFWRPVWAANFGCPLDFLAADIFLFLSSFYRTDLSAVHYLQFSVFSSLGAVGGTEGSLVTAINIFAVFVYRILLGSLRTSSNPRNPTWLPYKRISCIHQNTLKFSYRIIRLFLNLVVAFSQLKETAENLLTQRAQNYNGKLHRTTLASSLLCWNFC